MRRPGTIVGASLFGLFLLAALFGPLLAPQSPLAQNLDTLLAPPSGAHWLGTDENGGDLLSMVLFGARKALLIAGSTVGISFVVGTIVGALAGTVGGWVDETLMRLVDVLLSFPGILLNLAIVALSRQPSTAFVVFALTVNGWVGYARVARGQTLAVREREYVQAAWASGAGLARVLRRHVIPSILGPLIVQATFGFGGVILVEASLSFLGLGPALPYTWGALLAQGTTYLWRSTRLAAVPGGAIAVVVLGCNLLGDGLRDWLDPRGRSNVGP
ncbi:MAG TPA: ABC transporter permease [Polyangia bacterium]|jgi:peptide/nickel transport system permease protein